MTKLVYLDCPTGIAGDMCLGALISAGVPVEYLTEMLKKLGIEQEYRLRVENVHHNGQLATKVHVELLGTVDDHDHEDPDHHSHSHEHHHHTSTRHLPEIEQLIIDASLPLRVSQWSLAVFRKLAEAEGAVHGIPKEQVHFHEVGATDAIVDIVGTCLGLDWLGIDQLYCSALPTGGGTVWAAHGRLPVPVPAVMRLWESRQVPIYSNGIERELVTPTGAALVTTLSAAFGPPPAMSLQRVGMGAGSLQLAIPNILRLWIGEGDTKLPNLAASVAGNGWLESGDPPQPPFLRGENSFKASLFPDLGDSQSDRETMPTAPDLETITVLQTQIDDLSPQAVGYVFEALFLAGAVDVFTQAIGMKKSRPGVLLTVICHSEAIEPCEAVLFRETTTLGIRRFYQERKILSREIQKVQTQYGEVRIKVAWNNSLAKKAIAFTNVQPEYEDCAQLARVNNRPWREVHFLALQTWYQQQEQST